jgi:hypothetical protein
LLLLFKTSLAKICHLAHLHTPQARIRTLALFAEGIFQDDSMVVHPKMGDLGAQITAMVVPRSNTAITINVRAFLEPRTSSTKLIVKDFDVHLPKFALFKHVPVTAASAALELSAAAVTLPLEGPAYRQKVGQWLSKHFLLGSQVVLADELHMVYLRTMKPVALLIKHGSIKLHTSSMELAAELVQSLLVALGITELNTLADFPDDAEELRLILHTVNEFQSSRQRLSVRAFFGFNPPPPKLPTFWRVFSHFDIRLGFSVCVTSGLGRGGGRGRGEGGVRGGSKCRGRCSGCCRGRWG